jgi:hypothetical protein
VSESTVAVAADGWGKLKDAFREECGKINVRPHRYKLECVEPDEFHFEVTRLMGRLGTPGLSSQFQQTPPRIYWTNHLRQKIERQGHLDLNTTGKHVTYGVGGSSVVLGDFVIRKMMDLVR